MPIASRLLPIVLALASASAWAKPPVEEPDNLINDRFGLEAAFTWGSASTTVRLDNANGTLGTVLSGEDDLGLAKSKLLGRGDVWFRMKERHRARLSNYFLPLNRRATTVLDQTINFGNETFVVNERIQSELKLDILALSYSYSFIKNDRMELGASIGLDVVGFEAKATVPARLRTAREERSGPAPLIGLDGTVRISSRWYAEGRAQYLKVDVNDVNGTFKTFQVNAMYRYSPNITVGLGFNSFQINVDSLDPGDTGRFDIKASGPQLFARFGF